MGRADLHLHTTYSDGMGTVEAVLEAARRAGLDIIAITDHDTVLGALRGRDLGPRYGVGVIPGVEISTAEGHLLAYWVEHPIPPGRPLTFTLAAMLATMLGLWLTAAPSLLLAVGAAQLIQTALGLLITLRWKISMHGAAIAACVALLVFVLGRQAAPGLLAVPLVAWARVHLGRHTPAQTIAGAALGGLVTWAALTWSALI